MSAFLTEDQIQECQRLIAGAGEIVISTHKSPDGDAIGSSFALYNALLNMGKRATVLLPDEAPAFLQWMPGYHTALVHETHPEEVEALLNKADLIFSLDYNHLGRVGYGLEALLNKASAPFILIDHHQQPADYPTVTYSDTSSCSTAQMIYRFLWSCGWGGHIDTNVAQGIYCGIMTDSGSFRFPSVTAETHRIVANLMELGLDHATIHREVYDTNLLDRMRLVSYALYEKLEVLPEASTAFISLTKEELDRFNYRQGDTEGLVNQALSIKGIKLAAFFREGTNEIKVSLRSKGNLDVNSLSRRSWNGGGHFNAAGGHTTETMEQVLQRFRTESLAMATEINHS
jgi:phosphoesterase RecJ-like protein